MDINQTTLLDLQDYCQEDESQNYDEVDSPISNGKIFVDKTTRTIYELYRRYTKKEIDMSPFYQRKPMWVKPRQSKLIESILLDVPIQVIYLAELDSECNSTFCYEVVDGQQRLTAFFEFLDGKYKLEKLSILNSINGKVFSELEPKYQRAIEDYLLTVYIIKKESEKEAKFDIFERINIGSTNLNAQEIRNCVYARGKSAQGLKLLTELAQNKEFSSLVNSKMLEKRMKDEELVLRFMSYYLKGISNYTGSMTRFLNETLDNYSNYKDKLVNINKDFSKAMRYINEYFGKHAFIINPKSTQINFALFDVLSYYFSSYTEEFLINCKNIIIQTYKELLDNSEYRIALTANSSTKNNTFTRFNMWKETLEHNIKQKES